MPLILLEDMTSSGSATNTGINPGVSNASYINGGPGVPAPLPATSLDTLPGQTVLVIGIIANLDPSAYYVPVVVGTISSAANLYGYGPLTRALGELRRQGAGSIVAIALPNTDDLPRLFNYIVDLDFDVILPVGLPASPSFINQLGTFTYQREQLSKPVMVVMGATPAAAMLTTLNAPPGIYAPIIPGTYPNVTARNFVFTLDQVTVNPDLPSQYTTNAAASIAGLMTRKMPNVSITGATLYGVSASGLYSATDALNLSNSGYTVLRKTTRHGLVPYLGVTGTATGMLYNYSSGYHKITTIRCAQFVTSSIQRATRSLIGEPSGSAVSDIVRGVLGNLQTQGIIISSESRISIHQAASSITISVAILPPFETTMITVTSQVNFKAS